MDPFLVLASESKIRRKILSDAGYSFIAQKPALTTEPRPGPDQAADDYVLATARAKAGSLFEPFPVYPWVGLAATRPDILTNWPASAHKDYASWWQEAVPALKLDEVVRQALEKGVVIGSDQVVEWDGKILTKVEGQGAERFQRATERLQTLSGREHFLVGALSVYRQGREVYHTVSRVRVKVRRLTTAEIESYLNTELPYSSVACYFLEGQGIRLIEELDGSYFAALGFDLLSFNRFYYNFLSGG